MFILGLALLRHESDIIRTIPVRSSLGVYKELLTIFNCRCARGKLDDMLVSKKDSALGPDGLSCSVYRCAGGIGAPTFYSVQTGSS